MNNLRKLTFKSYAILEIQKMELKDLKQAITNTLALSILNHNNYQILHKDEILFQTLCFLTSEAYYNESILKRKLKKLFRKDKYHVYNFNIFTAIMIEDAINILSGLFDKYIEYLNS